MKRGIAPFQRNLAQVSLQTRPCQATSGPSKDFTRTLRALLSLLKAIFEPSRPLFGRGLKNQIQERGSRTAPRCGMQLQATESKKTSQHLPLLERRRTFWNYHHFDRSTAAALLIACIEWFATALTRSCHLLPTLTEPRDDYNGEGRVSNSLCVRVSGD